MPAIAYSFKLKGKEYGNDYVTRYYGGKWIVPDSASFKEGDSFMVEYEKSDPFVSRMLFKYAVKDSSDYRMWIKFFKSNPPK